MPLFFLFFDGGAQLTKFCMGLAVIGGAWIKAALLSERVRRRKQWTNFADRFPGRDLEQSSPPGLFVT
ncbi:hypothetical protein L211DRAFT_836239 [Terfezia boudieri ATCC MYA-4762]|uniref:Uncharacterized protein n=1 Tax=Terfezia boudieri ATCC MYA-4762 TaxID=1051890 RepID=A0A3N4LRI9_9PEZI|nr:hypothetical protein L211DRAFT_836239 [Terfezia boudieri ATCC MYA-4762]